MLSTFLAPKNSLIDQQMLKVHVLVIGDDDTKIQCRFVIEFIQLILKSERAKVAERRASRVLSE